MRGGLDIYRLEETATKPAHFAITFAPYGAGGGAQSPVNVYGEEKLRAFLKELGIQEHEIDKALNSLQKDGSASIEDRELTEEQLIKHGLHPLGVVESMREYLGALFASKPAR